MERVRLELVVWTHDRNDRLQMLASDYLNFAWCLQLEMLGIGCLNFAVCAIVVDVSFWSSVHGVGKISKLLNRSPKEKHGLEYPQPQHVAQHVKINSVDRTMAGTMSQVPQVTSAFALVPAPVGPFLH